MAFWDTDRSNADSTEVINNDIETIRRIARGFRNFDNYRLRILASASGRRPTATPPRQSGRDKQTTLNDEEPD